MSAALWPYSAYKDSGVAWLGEVPEHWDVLPNRALFAEVNDRDHPDEQMLSVTIAQGVLRQQSLLADSSKKDGSNQDKTAYKLVQPGDIAYNKMRAWQGSVGVSDHRGIVSPAYIVVRPRGDHNPRYFHYLLRTPAFAKEAERWSYGITSDQWSLRAEHFKMIYSALPPPAEQSGIVRFLEHADGRINRFIRAKRRMIELLNEQKQAILESLIEGDTESPQTKLKHVVDLLPGFAFSSSGFTTSDAEMRLLRGVNISPGSIRWSSTVRWPNEDVERFSRYQLQAGDLVIGMDRPWISTGIRVASISDDDLPALLLQRVGRLRAKPGLDQQYLQLLLTGRGFKEYFEPILTGISVPHISPEQILSYTAIIPTIVEQESIVRRFNEHSSSLETAIRLAQREIELIREYRTRLIADVVTGKLDVRGAKLPSLDTLDVTEGWVDEDAELESGDGDAEMAVDEVEV